MYKIKVTKQDAEKLLADSPEDRSFWCNDGRIFRNMRDLSDGLANMSDETFAYHSNDEKNDFSNWLKDVIEDEKLAKDLDDEKNDFSNWLKDVTEDEELVKDLEKSVTRLEVAKRVNDRVTFLNMKLS